MELRFNPLKRTGSTHQRDGEHAGLYDVDRIIKAASDATDEIEIHFDHQIKVGLILCFGRDMTWAANEVLSAKATKWAKVSSKIIGVDLAGSESKMSLKDKSDLVKMCDLMNNTGLPVTIHAGETDHVDLETFKKTVNAIRPRRIGHPIIAFKSAVIDNDHSGLELIAKLNIVV
jgi:adenosine deaminase